MSRYLALVLLALVAGCDSDVPAAAADGDAHTIWGQLDPTQARQALRVEPVSPTLDGRPEFVGRVVSEELETGAETVWRDSLVRFRDGSQGHVFLADLRPSYGSTHEVRVEREGETVTYARVTVPPRVRPVFEPLVVNARSHLDLLLPGAPRVVGARVLYSVVNTQAATPVGYVESVPVEPQDVTSIDVGWRVQIDFTRQVELLRNRLRQLDVTRFAATEVRIVVSVVNDEWAAPYPFTFSPDLVIVPGTVSNVRGGYGFVGAGYTLDVTWRATAEDLRRLGL